MRPPSLTAVQCADSPHSPAHAPCSPPATSHYTTGRLQAWDLCAPCRRLLHCGADFPAPTPPVREERSALRMAKKRSEPRRPSTPTAFEQARDELFSHILRCGVLEASVEHQKEWFDDTMLDRKSTRLNSSHPSISYAVFCLKKKKNSRYPRYFLNGESTDSTSTSYRCFPFWAISFIYPCVTEHFHNQDQNLFSLTTVLSTCR